MAMMKTKYQVFISSTFEDLKEERRKITEVILNMGHFPIGMELFNADDNKQWTQIKQAIDNSDFYILVVGQRYGSLTSRGISFTEKEYNYAKKKKIPILAFIIDDDVKLEKAKIDFGEKAEKLTIFKNKLSKRQCSFWKNADDLALKVHQSLTSKMQFYSKLGWIKIDDDINYSAHGIENYFYYSLNKLKDALRKGIYIDNFTRYIDLQFLKNGNLEVITSTRITYKNVRGKTNYFLPSPVFENEYEWKSYQNLIFEINHNNELDNIITKKEISSNTRQMRYKVINKIDLSKYKDVNDVYVIHTTKYIRETYDFFQFYQLRYPCRSLKVICDLRNKSDEYKIICSCSSTYLGTKNNVERSDIEKDGSRNIITFDNWSDIGYGFTITLKKIKK